MLERDLLEDRVKVLERRLNTLQDEHETIVGIATGRPDVVAAIAPKAAVDDLDALEKRVKELEKAAEPKAKSHLEHLEDDAAKVKADEKADEPKAKTSIFEDLGMSEPKGKK